MRVTLSRPTVHSEDITVLVSLSREEPVIMAEDMDHMTTLRELRTRVYLKTGSGFWHDGDTRRTLADVMGYDLTLTLGD